MQNVKRKMYKQLSTFQTNHQFKNEVRQHLAFFTECFTPSERIALNQLIRTSIPHRGVAVSTVCKMLAAAHASGNAVSRSTFERMLVKAKKLGIITMHHTIRETGGYHHSIYIFQPFTSSEKSSNQLTTPILLKKVNPVSQKTVHPSVPQEFTKATAPFAEWEPNLSVKLWSIAEASFKRMKFMDAIENHLPLIIRAFKQVILKYKKQKIQSTIYSYFYGTLLAKLAEEKRRIVRDRDGMPAWLEQM
ncbi:hypothetical protein [Alkalihalophilus marmarensis]|uniref:Uncharacterized protein n=1 Tax=Alkalihalophilus marmarensis DSM 21297 TaxID=1188261 RepID=U6SQI8_9BACI|nr:hypothetical protein [Alkalihalophilus marmarensis]ERN53853.1 hypothetical protein A33I_10260 [Alkalihalophilus marmarensis DSM 21297]